MSQTHAHQWGAAPMKIHTCNACDPFNKYDNPTRPRKSSFFYLYAEPFGSTTQSIGVLIRCSTVHRLGEGGENLRARAPPERSLIAGDTQRRDLVVCSSSCAGTAPAATPNSYGAAPSIVWAREERTCARAPLERSLIAGATQ